MAFRVAAQRVIQGNVGYMFGLRRLTHGLALPAPVSNAIEPVASPSLSLPESDSDFSCRLPGFASGCGSMDLMAVPKESVGRDLNVGMLCMMQVSRHKRGIRNGPKALKPTPVIIKCKSCGRVKLPHFYCCGGRREESGEATN